MALDFMALDFTPLDFTSFSLLLTGFLTGWVKD